MQQEQEERSILAVYLNIDYQTERYITVATYFSMKRAFQVCSFVDNEHYVTLESLLIQLNPKEKQVQFQIMVKLPGIKSQRSKLLAKLEQYEFKVDDSSFGTGELKIPLEFLLKRPLKLYTKQTENPKEMLPLQKLLNYFSLEQEPTNKNQFELTRLILAYNVKLDKAAINALQIFNQDMQKKIMAGTSTLYEILNRCKTSFGTRCLKRWMKQPIKDQVQLQRRLDTLQYFINNPQVKNIIQGQLKKLPDLDKLYYVFYKVAAGKKHKCQVSDLIKIYRTIETLKDMLNSLQKRNIDTDIISEIYQEIKKNVEIISKISMMIEKGIEMDSRDAQFYVKPATQPSLTGIMRQKNQLQRDIDTEMDKVRKLLCVEVERSQSTVYKYVLEASKKLAAEKVKETQGYKLISAKQTKITFTTQSIIRLCDQLRTVEEEYKTEQQTILNKMFSIVAGYYPVMEQLSTILSELDVITTIANVISTQTTTWCKPTLGTSIRGKGMFHPCIKNCVTNDCLIQQNAKTIILTGPNMGGKSTYIRNIGICVYLAHIGCYVPCKYFQTPIIDAIITRVGASDMQVKGISTFMSQMIESACMLQTATSNSLVLIDQLGRGTSTSEGFGIAWAICQYLSTKLQPYCLFATHFHEMTRMEGEVRGVKNMYTACCFQNGALKLEYKVESGKMEKSYGIEVAKMLNFPPGIIANAQQYLRTYQDNQNGQQEQLSIPPEKEDQLIRLFEEMNLRMAEQPLNSQNITQQYKAKMKQVLAV